VSLFRPQSKRYFGISGAGDLIPQRTATRAGTVTVTNDTALRHSAVWACLRLRADLVSTLPVDVYRRVNGRQVEMPKPPILVNPGGERVDWCEWMYSSQFDLDRAGNVFGLVTEVNSLGLPNRIDLQPLSECSVGREKGQLYYRIGGVRYEGQTLGKVWHERQFTVAGLDVGLSPIAYAAYAIGEYLSIQEFALNWFGDGAIPAAHLRNTQRTIPGPVITAVKATFKQAVANRDLFVSGNDWEYKPIQAEAMGNAWIEAKAASVVEIARFFGCPATQIDGAVAGSSVTYANLSQDELRLLINHLGPSITRRETKFSAKWLPQPRYVKLNSDALLRMDPKTRAEVIKIRIDARTMTPDQARELENDAPLTDADYAQFDRLFGSKNPAPAPAPVARAAAPALPTRGQLVDELIARLLEDDYIDGEIVPPVLEGPPKGSR
jgi:HK97 family phage portal protein